jgi:hypothetical protein
MRRGENHDHDEHYGQGHYRELLDLRDEYFHSIACPQLLDSGPVVHRFPANQAELQNAERRQTVSRNGLLSRKSHLAWLPRRSGDLSRYLLSRHFSHVLGGAL